MNGRCKTTVIFILCISAAFGVILKQKDALGDSADDQVALQMGEDEL